MLDAALDAFGEALRLDPRCATAELGIGVTLERRQDYRGAIVAYRRAVAFGSSDWRIHFKLGTLLSSREHDYDGAAAALREAVRLNGSSAEARCNLGNVLSKKGELAEAIASYEEALRLNPKLANASNGLAWLLATCADPKVRDPARAVQLASQAVDADRSNGAYWQTLAWARYRAGDWEAAIAGMEEVRRLGSPGDSVEWFLLAMAHWQLGSKDEARRWYDRAVEWMDENRPEDAEIRGYRAEAADLLGVAEAGRPSPSRPRE